MGLGYKGGALSYYSISDNVSEVSKTFPLKNGYFGNAGNNSKVRIIYSEDPNKTGKTFYDQIAYGGIESPLANGKGYKTNMADGTIITFRPTTSSDNNPGVDINIAKSNAHGDLKQQKIHFEKKV